jgi:D-alanine-D-alanine ligase
MRRYNLPSAANVIRSQDMVRMRIGITCTLKGSAAHDPNAPDDIEEEFDKPETVEAIAAVLRELGHEVEVLGDGPGLLRKLLDGPPDFAFNFAEGTSVSRSREARVPAVLEMLDIPYSGSDPLTLAVTLDKDCAKRLVESAGVAVPRSVLATPDRSVPPLDPESTAADQLRLLRVLEQVDAARLRFPVILKPAYEGSSKGIRHASVVESPDELPRPLGGMMSVYRQPILIEEFVAGAEVTVGVVGNDPPRVIGMMAIHPAVAEAAPRGRFVYSLEVKRDYERQVRYDIPPQLPHASLDRLHAAALQVYQTLGCCDVARVDFRLRDGEPCFLEVNPLPGLNPVYSDLVILARGYGITHAQLVGEIFDAACRRHGLDSGIRPSHAVAQAVPESLGRRAQRA